jgi:hypothetical protein
MPKKNGAGRERESFLKRHSLGIAAVGLLVLWIVLYSVWDQKTHLGSFFGNAIADWSGVVVTVLATKFLYEHGSKESKRDEHPPSSRLQRALKEHSLTIFLVITGLGWVLLFAHMESEAKWGQVVGNIVSEWTQVIGLVLLTKRLVERGSKESKG